MRIGEIQASVDISSVHRAVATLEGDVSVLVRHYSGHGWARYARKQVGFQVLSYGKWKTTVRGRAGPTYTSRSAAYYRACIAGTGSYWGSSSNRSHR